METSLGQHLPGFAPRACLREGLVVTSDSPKDGRPKV